MREHYNQQLELLCDQLEQLGQCCDQALTRALSALNQNSTPAACAAATDATPDTAAAADGNTLESFDDSTTLLQLARECENLCLNLILHQQPVASDFRLVGASLKIITDLQRIGVQAGDIAGIASHLTWRDPDALKLINTMANSVRAMVQDTIAAFTGQSQTLAQDVMDRDDAIDQMLIEARKLTIALITTQALTTAADNTKADPASCTLDAYAGALVDIMMIAKYLERIADHAVNVARWTLFLFTGQPPAQAPRSTPAKS